jgi:hypothetical protein
LFRAIIGFIAMKVFRLLLLTQCSYYLVTAIWPLVDINSFMLVTGYKTDIWLVKTVGVLFIPIALTLATYLPNAAPDKRVIILGGFTALVVCIIDFYYSGAGVISRIYRVDGCIQLAFISGWLSLGISVMKGKSHTGTS